MANRNDIAAGRAFISLFVNQDALLKGLAAAKRTLSEFGGSIATIGAGFTALGAGITAPLVAAVKYFESAGSALHDMSVRTGMSVESLAELKYAAEQSGASIGDVEGAVRKMQRAISEEPKGGGGKARKTGKGGGAVIEIDEEDAKGKAAAIRELGIDLESLKAATPDEQFSRLAKAIADIADPTKRGATAMEILGKSSPQLIPMIEDLAELRAEAVALGRPTTEEANLADDLGDAFGRVRAAAMNTAFSIGAQLAPAVRKISEGVKTAVLSVQEFVRAHPELTRAIAIGGVVLSAVGSSMVGFGLILKTISIATGAVIPFVKLLFTGFSLVGPVLLSILTPAGLVVAAIAAVAGAVLYFSGAGGGVVDYLRGKFAALLSWSREVFGGIANALGKGDLKLAAKIAWLAVQDVFLTSIDWIRATLRKLTGGVDVFDVIATAAKNAAGWIIKQWDKISDGAMEAWASIKTGVLDVWNFVSGRVADLATIFGGTWQAIAAGDFARAGQIAMLGLRIVFLEGIANLASAVGGGFGDMLGTMASQIAGGDFAGLWSTVVGGMNAVWQGFTSGIVSTFVESAKLVVSSAAAMGSAIINAFTVVHQSIVTGWRKSVNEITDVLLGMSAQGGVLGKIVSKVLGVDVSAEDARRTLLNKQAAEKGLAQQPESVLGESANLARKAVGDQAGAANAALDNFNRKAQQGIKETNDAIAQRLDSVAVAAEQRAAAAEEKFRTMIAGGAGKGNAALAEARAELDQLRAAADAAGAERDANAAKRAAARKKELADALAAANAGGGEQKAKGDGNKAAAEAPRRNAIVSFSASALIAQSSPGGRTAAQDARDNRKALQKAAHEAEEARKTQERLLRVAERQLQRLEQLNQFQQNFA